MKKYCLVLLLPLLMSCAKDWRQVEFPNDNPTYTPNGTNGNGSRDSTSNGSKTPIVDKTPGKIVLSEGDAKLVDRTNDFAFSLTDALFAKANGHSFVVSPLSVGYLLGMLNDGAMGATQEEIAMTLGFGNVSRETINKYFGNLLVNSPLVDERVDITSANALFANSAKEIQFAEQYAADMKGYYQAGVESLDFTSAESSLNRINGWCNETTNGMIPSILSRDEFNAAGLAYILNSIYFKADWTSAFDKEDTTPADFTTSEGKKLQLPMMHKQDDVQYLESEDMKVVAMSYGGGAYSMYVLLPDEGKLLADIIGNLGAEKWAQLVKEMKNTVMGVDIMMPKYETETDTDLASVLTTMGMRTAFTNEADYGNMLQTGDIYFDLMKQKARIEVSEEGTKAAAATIAGQVTLDEGGTDQEPQLPTFHATRPFLYIIMEQTTGAIFFMGIYSGEE